MPTVGDRSLAAVRSASLATVFARSAVAYQVLRRQQGRALTLLERAVWLHHAASLALHSIGVHVVAQGAAPTEGLLVSNHLSYLDVLVYASLLPCVFVSKREVAAWPIFGTFATMAGTIYVDRRPSNANQKAAGIMEQALQSGLPVVLFPEGTSSDGSRVLPFHSSFFEPAMRARVEVRAAAITYRSDTAAEADLAYCGDDAFVPHLLRTLTHRRLSAEVAFAPVAERYADRKQAARTAQAQVTSLRSYREAGHPSIDTAATENSFSRVAPSRAKVDIP